MIPFSSLPKKGKVLLFSVIICCFVPSSLAQNVGIGTLTPAFKMDVRNGSINTDSGYRISGATVLSISNISNLLIGNQGAALTTATGNTFAGYQAGNSVTNGSNNSFFGSRAGYSNVSGTYNTAIGFQAFYNNSTGYFNSANGFEAMYSNTDGGWNVANGYQALRSNSTGTYNTAIGNAALFSNITGTDNTAVGAYAGFDNTGSYNAFFGNAAGTNNTIGTNNSFIGANSGHSNISGRYNTAIGFQSFLSNTTGYYNTAAGYEALSANTDGGWNVATGYLALSSNTLGHNNTAVGHLALSTNSTGGDNTAIGHLAQAAVPGLTNSTAIGSRAFVNCNHCLVLGSIAGQNSATVSTNVGIGTSTPTSRLEVVGDSKVSGNITVQAGKGLIRNTSGVQLKKVSSNVIVNATINAGTTQIYAITFSEVFPSVPEVYIGNVISGSGGWAEVVMSVANVTSTGASLYIFNPRTTNGTINFTLRIIAIGAQ